MAKLKNFIERTEIENTDENFEKRNRLFKTTDLVFLDSYSDIRELSDEERITSLTDYAIANGAFQWCDGVSRTGKKGTSSYWQRSAYSQRRVSVVTGAGSCNSIYVEKTQLGVCPALHLNLSSIISARSASRDFGKIAHVKDTDGNVIYHTIEFGEYPKTKAINSDELERLFNEHIIFATGKKYAGHIEDSSKGTFTENLEYAYCGQKYVRVKITDMKTEISIQTGKKFRESDMFGLK